MRNPLSPSNLDTTNSPPAKRGTIPRAFLSSLTRNKSADSTESTELNYEHDNEWQLLPWLEQMERGEHTADVGLKPIKQKQSIWETLSSRPSTNNSDGVILVK